MERFYTQILGSPVRDGDVRPLTTVRDVLIDPSNGRVCSLEVDSGKNMVVTPIDIISWHDGIVINGADSIVPAEDILRVSEILKQNIRIHKSAVESKNGTYLGKVFDFSIDPKSFDLKKLYVAKNILGLVRYDKRIIPSKDIIEILSGKIIVKSDKAAIEAKEEERISVKGVASA